MGADRRRIRRFLCFGVPAGAVAEEAAEEASGSTDPELRHRRRLLRRIATRLVRSLSSQSLNRSGRLRDDLSRSLTKKALEATKSLPESVRKSTEDDQRTDPIYAISASSSSSSASSLFSSDSSSSSSSFPAPETAISRRKRAPPMAESKKTAPDPVRRRNYDALTGLCLLVVSLSIMVFCGRVWAILWTSTWLCLVPGRSLSAVAAVPGEAAVVEELAELRPRGCDECEKKRVVLEGLLERSPRV